MDNQVIESFINEYNEFVNEFSKKAQEKLKDVLNQFFDENPGVNVITWTQYAPYFNDGDPCVFSVNETTFSNATDEDDIRELYYGEYNGETEGIWGTSSWRVEEKLKDVQGVNPESIKMISNFIQSKAMEDVLRTSLGEDNRIVVTRAGIVSEDYSGSHD